MENECLGLAGRLKILLVPSEINSLPTISMSLR